MLFASNAARKKLVCGCIWRQVMLNTSRFVAEAGGQAELVLRVRQATNPNFAFLKPVSQHWQYHMSSDCSSTSTISEDQIPMGDTSPEQAWGLVVCPGPPPAPLLPLAPARAPAGDTPRLLRSGPVHGSIRVEHTTVNVLAEHYLLAKGHN